MKKKAKGKRYSEVFKRQVVRDIERGKMTPTEVARKYGITGTMTIANWLKRYGTGRVSAQQAKQPRVVQSRERQVLERRNRELEQALARLTVEKVALEAVVEEAEAHFGVDLKKTALQTL